MAISTYNARDYLKNPDPTWIVNWSALRRGDNLSPAKRVCEVMATAAVRREWQKMCYQRFEEYAAEVQGRLAATKKLIAEKQKKTDYYARISLLLTLKAKEYLSRVFADGHRHPVAPNGRQLKIRRNSFQPRVDARRFYLEKMIADAFVAQRIPYLYTFLRMSPTTEELRAMVPITDAKLERDRYCYYAMGGSIKGVPSMPVLNIGGGEAGEFVKPVLNATRIKEIKEHEKRAQARVWKVFGSLQSVDGYGYQKREIIPKGIFKSKIVIKKVKRRKGKVIVTARESSRNVVPDRSRCRRGRYGAVSCAKITLINDSHTTLLLEGVPARITDAFKRGDALSFLAKGVSHKQRTISKSRRKRHFSLKQTMSVVHLLSHCSGETKTCQRYW